METTLGVFLHDIGKFMQRAHGSVKNMSPKVRQLESVILPVRGGNYTHKHALWSEQFFQWMDDEGLSFPDGINRQQVRDVAVFHHNPTVNGEAGAMGWLCAEADRLSSGLERKAKDEGAEAAGGHGAWDQFIKTALHCPYNAVDLGLGNEEPSVVPLGVLEPGGAIAPVKKAAVESYQEQYQELWKKFAEEFRGVIQTQNAEVFCEGVLSLSERYLFAIPSSTVDQPDISLHDHHRVAAAIAAAAYGWHAETGTLDDAKAIQDRDAKKYRFLVGDLSGIQSTLFQLANEQVKGLNRILRARSFLFGMTVEAAALHCRRELGLPVFSVVQNAGGRLLMLVPATRGMDGKIEQIRRTIEAWIYGRYYGGLSLNLSLSGSFAGKDFLNGRFTSVMEMTGLAAEEGKQRAFSTCADPVHRQADYTNGRCSACGVRPATEVERQDEAEVWRCAACNDEAQFGRKLPRIRALGWMVQGQTREAIPFFGGLFLEGLEEARTPASRFISLSRIYAGGETAPGAAALRFLPNYVPRVRGVDLERYRDLLEPAERDGVAVGDTKTFEMLGLDALERDEEGAWRGEPLLGVLKADVDRLGAVFGEGIQEPVMSRFAAISRMTDFFFTGRLWNLLERDFPDTYTVYSGGDDLLLIGPWIQMPSLAIRLAEEFRQWTGKNPNITISAGLELMKASQPVNLAVGGAEERLERAKDGGRNRVCAFSEDALKWEAFSTQLTQGDPLHGYLRDGTLPLSFVYKILHFAEERKRAETVFDLGSANWRTRYGYQIARQFPKRAETVFDLGSANWRARYGYQIARQFPKREEAGTRAVIQHVNGLLGLNGDLQSTQGEAKYVPPRAAITMAVYRNRKSRGKE
jgi:CRISPR-associated protein Csm1